MGVICGGMKSLVSLAKQKQMHQEQIAFTLSQRQFVFFFLGWEVGSGESRERDHTLVLFLFAVFAFLKQND